MLCSLVRVFDPCFHSWSLFAFGLNSEFASVIVMVMGLQVGVVSCLPRLSSQVIIPSSYAAALCSPLPYLPLL